MKYFLVLLSDEPEGGPEHAVASAHERFIDSLIERDLVAETSPPRPQLLGTIHSCGMLGSV